MIYPVYILGSRVLRAQSENIGPEFEGLRELADSMFETMYASDGIGLAAPQVGKSLRMFVIDASPMADIDPAAAGFKRVMINPEITEESDTEVLMGEGCLSLPGIHEDVYRPEEITVRYLDLDMREHEEHLAGWPARVVQHEYDHIEGMVFTDHLPALRRTLLKGRLAAMAKGRYSADYRTKQVR